MANAGYSSDYKLCKAVTCGLWQGYKRPWLIRQLPEHKDEDDVHQTALKNILYEYYNVYYKDLENKTSNVWNTKLRRLDKIIYRLNQYRQKHWYWKAII